MAPLHEDQEENRRIWHQRRREGEMMQSLISNSGEMIDYGKLNNDFRNVIKLGFHYSYTKI